MWSRNTTSLIVREPGLYRCELMLIGCEADAEVGLVLNAEQVRYERSQNKGLSSVFVELLRIDKNSNISVHYSGRHGSAMLCLQRL